MVVFTCNHCGDSLQKPRVEKHYAMQCRNVKFLTCVDCHKDFREEEYVAHTKCITEEQRYAAKGSVSAASMVKKGEVKQESWMDMIKSIVATETDISPGIRNLLNRISEFTNVPRKKPKFANFLKNSTGGRVSPDDIETAWALIEKHCKNSPQNTKSENDNNKSEKGEKRKLEENGQESPKKKKSKKSENTENSDVQENGDANDSKKSRKKRKLENGDEDGAILEPAASNGVGQRITMKKFEGLTELAEDSGNPKHEDQPNGDNLDENTNSKKTRKDKRKFKDIDSNNSRPAEDDHQETDADLAKTEKKKKKKSKQSLDNGSSFETENIDSVDQNNGTHQEIVDAEVAKTEKKKKKKSKQSLENERSLEIENQHNGVNSEEPKKKKKRDSQGPPELDGQTGSENLEQTSQESNNLEISKTSGADKSADSTNGLDASTVSSENFDFESKIIEILTAKKEMPCKKLQKKVLGAYLAETGESECTEKIMKKYRKQLKKLDNVYLKDDVVKIV